MKLLKHFFKPSKKYSLLVWVFPIAQLSRSENTFFESSYSIISVEEIKDSRVVMRGDIKGMSGHKFSLLCCSRHAMILQNVKKKSILFARRNNQYVSEI